MRISFYCLALFIASISAHGIHRSRNDVAVASNVDKILSTLFHTDGVLNLDHLENELDKCSVVKDLNAHLEEEHSDHEESFIQQLFEKLFPFGPAWNSVLATCYISGPPNLLLSLLPASIDPSRLTFLVSFAVGGLLGDVFLHLLPQTFLGEPVDTKAHFVFVDEKRNIILGGFIFVGFMLFWLIDKSLRILNHGEESEHGHSHSHSHSHSSHVDHAESSAIEAKDSKNIRNRSKKENQDNGEEEDSKPEEPAKQDISSSVRTAAYLNLISDFTHNITDGLAITSAFYISRPVGSTTALAVFLHEVPHEIGDFAVLIQGGFSKWQAMGSQFVTAIGAFTGCFIGIAIQQWAASTSVIVASSELGTAVVSGSNGLFGTTVTIGDLTLPFTAGGFLYIATVGVIPEILELDESTSRFGEVKKAIGQIIGIAMGIGMMFAISWFE
ncbi:Zn(2+) transporter [Saccharomycopsis crataegensis]|uniref:Zn(2+) transporter n=1 Tax=Saccharomycopsis crataegensis TaxID=43959 RepID=A0AAV5QVX8_9ASCO|nr:Zn(2+) transporter [Saccharomycopsis crataegensis]